MPSSIEVRPLEAKDLPEADRVFRLAFGTQLGLADPASFRGDSEMLAPRWRTDRSGALGAFRGGELVGSSIAMRWGSFGLFGPVSVRPDCWALGAGKALLAASVAIFDRWRVRHAGLFTFPQSAKHVALYQKFGFWPGELTAVMAKEAAKSGAVDLDVPAAAECAELTDEILPGLDAGQEIRAARELGLGDAIGVRGEGRLQAFAVCHSGKGSEAGSGTTFVKFGAVRPGPDAARWFERLLDACDAVAARRGSAQLVAGVNVARRAAYRALLGRGYRTFLQGVAMQRPDEPAFNAPGIFVLDDWR